MMNPERWRQVDELFQAALERAPEDRSVFVSEACGGDDSLRLEVEELLAADGEAGSLIEAPAYAVAAPLIVESDTPSLSGKTIGHYQIISLLGKGGMGEVYRARDNKLRREVAIKVLPAVFSSDQDRLHRFKREAYAASALNHPNILTVHEIGEVTGTHFLITELVEGQTLRQRLAGGRLELNEVLDVVIQVAAALAAANAAGVVHRDIKPENVMVRPDGLVKVLDFGLAKLAESSTPTTALQAPTNAQSSTEAGVVMGTARYMSPEQARGLKVDARSDIFSLGVVLYELVSGHAPFEGETMSDVIAAILTAEPPPLASHMQKVPAELDRIVRECLEKERERRYQSARELLVDLKNLKRESESTTSPAAKDEGLLSRIKRHKMGLVVALLALVVMIVTYGASLLRHRFQAAKPALHPLKRLTFDPGFQTDPTWSPNGDFIAYGSDRGGNFDIWVQPVSGGDPIQVTHSTASDTMADWSPDGTQIVFRSEREGGGLFVVPAFGGRERKISGFGIYPQWSPDGTKILFRDGFLGTAYQKLYVVALDGQPPRQVLSEFTAEFVNLFTRPFWHPDGRRITVLGTKKAVVDYGLWVVPLTGGPAVKSEPTAEVEKQFQENHLAEISEASWSPSGREMYFTAFSNSGNSVRFFCKVTVDPLSLRWVAGPEQLTTDIGFDYSLALSRDGKRLAFLIGSETLRIWSFPFDSGAGKVKGQGQPIISNGMDPGSLNLSPDGKRLAFLASRPGFQKLELWEKSLEDGKEISLATTRLHSKPICWSRDGGRIAYCGSRPPIPGREHDSILVQPSGGGDEQIITSGAGDLVWDWTADGNWILASTDRNSPLRFGQLCLYPLSAAPHAEAQVRVITASPEGELFQARISPNDRWICFEGTKSGGTSDIYVISASGGEWTRITDGKIWYDKPCWAPDGKTLYFIAKNDLFYNVWGIRFDPLTGKPVGAPFRVTNFESFSQMISPNLTAQEFGLTANRLVLPISEITGSIWILENVDK